MLNKGFFICLTGIDGSGKTTLSRALVKDLNSKGIPCEYVYARLNPFFSKPFIIIGEILFLHNKNRSNDYSDYSYSKRSAINNHSTLAAIYKYILLSDYFIQICYKIIIPLLTNENIVCDRYVYDTVITDLSVDMNYSEKETINLLNKLLKIFPRPNLTILIDLPEEIAYSRKNDVPSIQYLQERRNTYLTIGKEENMVILDGSEKFIELKDSLRSEISKVLKTRTT